MVSPGLRGRTGRSGPTSCTSTSRSPSVLKRGGHRERAWQGEGATSAGVKERSSPQGKDAIDGRARAQRENAARECSAPEFEHDAGVGEGLRSGQLSPSVLRCTAREAEKQRRVGFHAGSEERQSVLARRSAVSHHSSWHVSERRKSSLLHASEGEHEVEQRGLSEWVPLAEPTGYLGGRRYGLDAGNRGRK